MTSDTLVAPYSGTLVIRYDSANALDSEINANADLTVTNNGQSLEVDTVVNHLGPSIQSTYFCTQPSTVFGDWFRYYPGQGAQDSLWTVGQVTEGDKIAFDYDGKRVGYTYLTGATSDSTWVGGAEGCYDLPVFYYEDAVWITAMIEPNSDAVLLGLPATEVWPTIPTGSGASVWHDQIISEVEEVLSPITITVIENGAPSEGADVELKMAWVDTSGGHVHADPIQNPPSVVHLPASGLGSFSLLSGTAVSVTDSLIVATTDSSGRITVSYTAGEFGGEVTFTASVTVQGNELMSTKMVHVRVPGLTLLPDTSQAVYKKLGGDYNHPGPDDTHFGGNYQHDPDYNHWVRTDVMPHILGIVSDWNAKGNSVLFINDISLIDGGWFDVNGRWSGSHNSHRVGRDADILTTTTEGGDGVWVHQETYADGSPVVFPKGRKLGNSGFEQLVEDNCGRVYPELSLNHYHIRFYPDSMINCQ